MTKNLLLLITAITISLFAVSQAPLYAATSINPKNNNHQSTVALTNAAPLSINDCTLSTSIDTIIGWHTGDFTATFTDTICSPNTKRFFIAENRNNDNSAANRAIGFLSLTFDLLNAIYIGFGTNGIWDISNHALYQSQDVGTGSENTNRYFTVFQDTPEPYLYTWQDKITGSQTGKRAGVHFLCDNASKSNRGNSYLVRYSADADKMQLYKSVNNTLQLKLEVPITVDTDVWYNHQVMYSPNTGKIIVFRNNQFVGSWTDTNPLTEGSSLSFRSEKCKYWVDNVRIFRQRTDSQLITINSGADNLIDIPDTYYDGNNFYILSALISETACSNIDIMPFKVDITPPSSGYINAVINSTSEITVSWMGNGEPQSGIVNYNYSIGSTPGATDILSWTDNGLSTSFTANNLSFIIGYTYYVNVQTTNEAGLIGISTSSGSTVPTENPCNTPTNLNISLQSSNIAYLTCNPTIGAYDYVFRYRPTGTTTWTYIQEGIPAQYTGVLLTGTQYEVQTGAICSETSSPFSPSVYFDTFPECIPPQNISTSNVTANSAYLSWDAVPNIDSYVIQGRKVGSANWTIITTNTPYKQLSSNALLACTNYEWKVASGCWLYTSDFSQKTTFTTTCPNPISSNTEANKNNWQTEPQFSILPNPAQDLVYLTGSTNQDNALHIGIYSLTGQQLIEQYHNIEAGQINIPIQTNQLLKGYYLIEVDNGITKWHNKLVIIR